MNEYKVTTGECVLGDLPEGWLNFFLDCEQCEEEMKVDYKGAPPNSVTCPSCSSEIVIYKCLNCRARYEEGDQGFITLDVPYGSTVWDNMYGPAYACSSKCLVEAFKNDSLNCKGMLKGMLREGGELCCRGHS